VGKGTQCKDVRKEILPVYDGKFLSRTAVHSWVGKFSQGRTKAEDDARSCAEVAETTVKRLLCCGFRCTGKATGQVYQSWRRIHREINVLSMFEYHIFYVLYPFVTYSPTLPRICLKTVGLRTIKDQIYRYFSSRLHDKIVDMHLNYRHRN
jgi:hypothetical protein